MNHMYMLIGWVKLGILASIVIGVIRTIPLRRFGLNRLKEVTVGSDAPPPENLEELKAFISAGPNLAPKDYGQMLAVRKAIVDAQSVPAISTESRDVIAAAISLYRFLMRRRFIGSLMSVAVMIALCALAGYTIYDHLNQHGSVGPNFSWALLMLECTLVYIVSTRRPNFLMLAGKGGTSGLGFFNAIMGVSTITMAASTEKITTHWSDGSVTVEHDDSVPMAASLGLLVVTLVLTPILVTIAAAINIFRNYILYR